MPADLKEIAFTVRHVKGNRWVVDEGAPVVTLESLPEYLDAFPVKGLNFHPTEIAAVMLAEILYGGPKENPEHKLWRED